MTIITILVIIHISFFLLIRKEKRWMNYGYNKQNRYIFGNTHKYYLEEVQFDSFNESLNKYFKICEEIGNYGKVVDTKYDLYDWSSSIIEFEDTTIEIQHLRSLKKVRIIKSEKPISIEDYELDNPL
jgi:hypothetical protein